MSFDSLTIFGICAALLCGGFLIALVKRNDVSTRAFRAVGDSQSSGVAEL